ncbi:MAG: glycosyltransferase family 1 protein [Planctomycetes bacterium]|nr:glycosyltransferase family 1 protein [Planctomycetota bacterium]
MAFERARVKWRRHWLALRAAWRRPAVARAARAAAPGMHRIVVPPRVLDTYEETAGGIADGFAALGRDAVVECVDDLARLAPLKRGDRVIVFGAHRYEPWRPPAGVLLVGVNVEQYPPDWTPHGTSVVHMAKTDRFLAGCDLLLECNECLLEESARRGRPAAGVLPFAYTPRFDSGLPPLAKPPFEIAFLGRPGDGRRKEALARLGARFRLAPATVAWGRARGEFLRRAQLQLNLHQGEEAVLESHRFALCLANGAFVLSEPLPASAPFRDGVHYAAAPLAQWDDAIAHWLARPEERARIAEAGRRFLREEYAFPRALAQLLPLLDAAAAR